MSPRLALILALAASTAGASGAEAPPSSPDGLVDQGKFDARLRGVRAPVGFRTRLVAAEPAVVAPTAMAFDDAGRLYVVERKPSDRTFETWEILPLPEGGTARVKRRRKGSLDQVKRLKDADNDGVFESSEVVVEGAELPSAVLPYKGALYLGCVGRLERWTDEDGDGKFETRSVLVDGLAAGLRSLEGITLGADGWLYLATGDDDAHAIGPDGSRVDLARTGALYRCRPDGSKLALFASGLRDPKGGVAFDANLAPILVDDGTDDGSKFAGVRLVAPVEGGDYGWRLGPEPGSGPDFDRGAVDGERPGKLPVVARLGRGLASGLVVYHGIALPEACRDRVIIADPLRQSVRGIKLEPRPTGPALGGETTLLASDDPSFRPIQVVTGADGSLYVLDGRSRPEAGRPWGDAPSGRIYRLTSEVDSTSVLGPARPNHWGRITSANNYDLCYQWLPSPDLAEAGRAQRELVERASEAKGQVMADARSTFLDYAAKPTARPHARLLGLQGARQLWSDEVEGGMLLLLNDPWPEVRRLAAQALAWEPRGASPKLVPKLLERLDDPDPRAAREAALAIGRHAEGRPQQAAVALVRWLYGHPQADPIVKDGVLRALERMGDAGIEEVALAIRTRRGTEREAAVGWFLGFRSGHAAEQLAGLAKIPDLGAPERLALVRQFRDIPAEIHPSTAGLAEWAVGHPEADPAVKLSALDACRLAGNPASALIVALLDDDDESVRLAATRASGQSRPPGSFAKLAARLAAAGTSPAERLAIARGLRGAGPQAFAPLEAAYLGSDDFAFRRAALRSMAEANRARAMPALEGALTGRDEGLKLEAVRALAETAQGVALLARAPVDPTTRPAVLAAIRKGGGEAQVARPLAQVDPSQLRAPGEGDPWLGLGVFARESTVRCATCHRTEGRGAQGSALTGIRNLPAERLVEALLKHPSVGGPAAESGSRLASTDPKVPPGTEVIRPSTAGPPRFPSVELTPAELLDVAAFLRSPPAREAWARGPSRVARVLAVGPLAPGADKLRAPLDKVDPARPLPGQDGASAPWLALEASGPGVFDLRGEFAAKPGRAYLAFQVRSDREQAAALRFAIEGAARVYLDGAKVADVPERGEDDLARAFAPTAPGVLAPLPGVARLDLKAGPNLVVIALDRSSTGDARVALEVAAPGPIEPRLPRD